MSEAVWQLEALGGLWRAVEQRQRDRGSIPPSAFTLQEKTNDTGHRKEDKKNLPQANDKGQRSMLPSVLTLPSFSKRSPTTEEIGGGTTQATEQRQKTQDSSGCGTAVFYYYPTKGLTYIYAHRFVVKV